MFNNKSEIEKVAIYIRVSTEDQAKEGFSLPAQEKKLRAYCQSREPEWKIHDIYIDDGYTGRNTKRPAYQQMFQDIDHWDGILCLKMDRMHRNQKNFIEMMNLLKKNDKEFISSQESFDTSTAMGRFVMNIIQGIAQLESEQNAERVTMAMIEKALNSDKSYTGGRPPFGYQYNNGRVMDVPDEQEIIKNVFKLYSEGHTMQEISNKIGRPWSQIRYWLNNVFYIGLFQWGNCFKKIPKEPLISLDLWNLVQTYKRKDITKSHKDGKCRCGSSNITKAGHRGSKQRWRCKDCGYRFVMNPMKPGPIKPFILDEMPESFILSDKEMREYGFGMDIIKNQIK